MRGYIHKALRWVKVMLIPKPGKATCTEVKAYCPISQLYFMLETMKKFVDRYNRDKILGLHILHQYQFAYHPGKAPETTVHHVITHC
jgi:hypothetical protein